MRDIISPLDGLRSGMAWRRGGGVALEVVGYAFASNATTALSFTVNLSSLSAGEVREGDYVLAFVSRSAQPETYTMSGDQSGAYDLLATSVSDDIYDTLTFAFGKRMGATPDATLTITKTLGTLATSICHAFVIRGSNAASPLDTTATTASGTNGSLIACPSITTVTDGCLIFAFGAAGMASAVDATSRADTPSNMDNRLWYFQNPTQVMMARHLQSAAGTFTPSVTTNTLTTAQHSWSAITVAIRPA